MKRLIIIMACFSLLACKKSKKTPPAPQQAVLVSPAANEACTNGTIVSPTISSVTLKWNAAANADSYEVSVKNLISQAVTKHSTNGTELVLNLSSNTPFSWQVISKSVSSTAVGTSETRKFYNAGQAASFFAPFPPDNLMPAIGQTVNATNGTINLSWTAEDADNDLSSYDVYFRQKDQGELVLLQGNITAKKLDNVPVTANTTYRWKVVARDAKGNTAESQIIEFRVN